MANTYQEANAAADSINSTFGKLDGFLGVGIGKENDDFVVSIRVSHTFATPLPQSINGIPVQVIKQDMPVAL